MSFTETEKRIREAREVQYAYEANFTHYTEKLRKGEASVKKTLEAINCNKMRYLFIRRGLENSGIDISELPLELNYAEMIN